LIPLIIYHNTSSILLVFTLSINTFVLCSIIELPFRRRHLLATEQYGFRNNFSTEKASFRLINEILAAVNNNLKSVEYSVTYKKHLTL